MPNIFTRVPGGEPPQLAPNLVMVRLADLFMKLMYSTPDSGTLANTWVTPATLWLCAVCAPGLLLVAWFAIAGGQWWSLLLGALCVLLAIGSGAVVGVAIAQKSGPQRLS